MNATRGWTPPQAFWEYLAAARERISERAPDADVSALVPPGSHIVVVRAFDAAGNTVSRDIEAK